MISLKDCKYKENKDIFTKAYESINARSSEAWFGINNPLRVGLIAHFRIIETMYIDAYEQGKKNVNKLKFTKSIQEELDKIEHLIESELNVKSCKIGLIDDLDAASYIMCWDTNIIGTKAEAKKLRASLDDIIETNDGFKYKEKEGKYIILAVGLRFFEPKQNFSVEEIAAIVLHELGHSMQQMMTNIQTTLVNNVLMTSIRSGYENLKLSNIIKSLFTFNAFEIILSIFRPLLAIANIVDADVMKYKINRDSTASGNKLLDNMAPYESVDREKISETTKDNNNNMLIHSLKKTSIAGKIFEKTMNGVATLLKTLFLPIAFIIDAPANIYVLANNKYITSNKRNEEFADMFATYYGLGKELSSGLAKLGNEYHKADFGALNFLNYVPIVNVAVNYEYYTELNNKILLAGYPEMRIRMANIYKGLEYELENNKDLSSKEKMEIINQIKDTKDIYNNFVFGKGAKNFVYKIYQTAIKTTIEKDGNESSVSDNVIAAVEGSKKKASDEESAIA